MVIKVIQKRGGEEVSKLMPEISGTTIFHVPGETVLPPRIFVPFRQALRNWVAHSVQMTIT